MSEIEAAETDLLDEPFDLLPCVGLAVPHAGVDPLSGVLLEFLAILLHEDRI